MSGGFSSLQGEIKTDLATRTMYSRDASIFEVVPKGVIAPKGTDDLKILISLATKLAVQGRPISYTARNGGTDMSGGPLTEGWVLDMSAHFNQMHPVDEYHHRVWVQGGVMHRDVEKAARAKGLYFAPYTSSHEICGIGGMIGNDASGEKSLQHGPTSKNIDRLKAVLSDGSEYEFGPLTRKQLALKRAQTGFEGDLYRGMLKMLEDNKLLIATRHPRTAKNAAGYALWDIWNEDRTVFNLARLFIGSQGTLGITTAAELRLVEVAKYSRMIVTPINDLEALTPVVTTMLSHKPATCEMFDHYTYELALQYYPKEAQRAKSAAGKRMVVLSIFESDDKQELEHVSKAALADLTKQGFDSAIIDEQRVVDSFLQIRRKSTAMLMDHPQGAYKAEAFIEDTIVPLEHYSLFLGELEVMLENYDMKYTYAGHIGSGSLRLIPLVDMSRAESPQRIMELESRVNTLVLKYGGSISVDHNDGIIRTPYLTQQYGHHMVGLFTQVKNMFDPFNIFNPGKKVGGTYAYALEHIARVDENAH